MHLLNPLYLLSDEMSSGHGHSHHDHNHSGHDHDHDHDHEAPLISGPADSLFSQVDMPNVIAMNAVDGPEAGQRVIK